MAIKVDETSKLKEYEEAIKKAQAKKVAPTTSTTKTTPTVAQANKLPEPKVTAPKTEVKSVPTVAQANQLPEPKVTAPKTEVKSVPMVENYSKELNLENKQVKTLDTEGVKPLDAQGLVKSPQEYLQNSKDIEKKNKEIIQKTANQTYAQTVLPKEEKQVKLDDFSYTTANEEDIKAYEAYKNPTALDITKKIGSEFIGNVYESIVKPTKNVKTYKEEQEGLLSFEDFLVKTRNKKTYLYEEKKSDVLNLIKDMSPTKAQEFLEEQGLNLSTYKEDQLKTFVQEQVRSGNLSEQGAYDIFQNTGTMEYIDVAGGVYQYAQEDINNLVNNIDFVERYRSMIENNDQESANALFKEFLTGKELPIIIENIPLNMQLEMPKTLGVLKEATFSDIVDKNIEALLQEASDLGNLVDIPTFYNVFKNALTSQIIDSYEKQLQDNGYEMTRQDIIDKAEGISAGFVASKKYLVDYANKDIEAQRYFERKYGNLVATSDFTDFMLNTTPDATRSIGQMLPSIGTIAVGAFLAPYTGGLSLALANESVVLASMAQRVINQTYSNDIAQGYSPNVSLSHAVLSAGIEVISEKIFPTFNGIKLNIAGESIVKDVVFKMAQNTNIQMFMELSRNVMEEGFEEYVAEVLNSGVENILKYKLSDINPTANPEAVRRAIINDMILATSSETAGQSFILGAISAGIMGATQMSIAKGANVIKDYTNDTLVKTSDSIAKTMLKKGYVSNYQMNDLDIVFVKEEDGKISTYEEDGKSVFTYNFDLKDQEKLNEKYAELKKQGYSIQSMENGSVDIDGNLTLNKFTINNQALEDGTNRVIIKKNDKMLQVVAHEVGHIIKKVFDNLGIPFYKDYMEKLYTQFTADGKLMYDPYANSRSSLFTYRKEGKDWYARSIFDPKTEYRVGTLDYALARKRTSNPVYYKYTNEQIKEELIVDLFGYILALNPVALRRMFNIDTVLSGKEQLARSIDDMFIKFGGKSAMKKFSKGTASPNIKEDINWKLSNDFGGVASQFMSDVYNMYQGAFNSYEALKAQNTAFDKLVYNEQILTKDQMFSANEIELTKHNTLARSIEISEASDFTNIEAVNNIVYEAKKYVDIKTDGVVKNPFVINAIGDIIKIEDLKETPYAIDIDYFINKENKDFENNIFAELSLIKDQDQLTSIVQDSLKKLNSLNQKSGINLNPMILFEHAKGGNDVRTVQFRIMGFVSEDLANILSALSSQQAYNVIEEKTIYPSSRSVSQYLESTSSSKYAQIQSTMKHKGLKLNSIDVINQKIADNTQVKDVRAILEKNVKKEEIQWTGLEEYLRSFKDDKTKINKNDLLNIISKFDPYVTLSENAPQSYKHFSRKYEVYREYLLKFTSNYLPRSFSNKAMKTHWNQNGVLAHARLSEGFTLNENNEFKKTLFVEELQSDILQEITKNDNPNDFEYILNQSEDKKDISENKKELSKIKKSFNKKVGEFFNETLKGYSNKTIVGNRAINFDEFKLLTNKNFNINKKEHFDVFLKFAKNNSWTAKGQQEEYLRSVFLNPKELINETFGDKKFVTDATNLVELFFRTKGMLNILSEFKIKNNTIQDYLEAFGIDEYIFRENNREFLKNKNKYLNVSDNNIIDPNITFQELFSFTEEDVNKLNNLIENGFAGHKDYNNIDLSNPLNKFKKEFNENFGSEIKITNINLNEYGTSFYLNRVSYDKETFSMSLNIRVYLNIDFMFKGVMERSYTVGTYEIANRLIVGKKSSNKFANKISERSLSFKEYFNDKQFIPFISNTLLNSTADNAIVRKIVQSPLFDANVLKLKEDIKEDFEKMYELNSIVKKEKLNLPQKTVLPFQNNYTELMIKQMLILAEEKGIDQISFEDPLVVMSNWFGSTVFDKLLITSTYDIVYAYGNEGKFYVSAKIYPYVYDSINHIYENSTYTNKISFTFDPIKVLSDRENISDLIKEKIEKQVVDTMKNFDLEEGKIEYISKQIENRIKELSKKDLEKMYNSKNNQINIVLSTPSERDYRSNLFKSEGFGVREDYFIDLKPTILSKSLDGYIKNYRNDVLKTFNKLANKYGANVSYKNVYEKEFSLEFENKLKENLKQKKNEIINDIDSFFDIFEYKDNKIVKIKDEFDNFIYTRHSEEKIMLNSLSWMSNILLKIKNNLVLSDGFHFSEKTVEYLFEAKLETDNFYIVSKQQTNGLKNEISDLLYRIHANLGSLNYIYNQINNFNVKFYEDRILDTAFKLKNKQRNKMLENLTIELSPQLKQAIRENDQTLFSADEKEDAYLTLNDDTKHKGYFSNLRNLLIQKMQNRAKVSDILAIASKARKTEVDLFLTPFISKFSPNDMIEKDELLKSMYDLEPAITFEKIDTNYANFMFSQKNYEVYVLRAKREDLEYQSHFGDDNISHILASSVYNAENKSNIFIEEHQSDVHQKGSKEGYHVNNKNLAQRILVNSIREVAKEMPIINRDENAKYFITSQIRNPYATEIKEYAGKYSDKLKTNPLYTVTKFENSNSINEIVSKHFGANLEVEIYTDEKIDKILAKYSRDGKIEKIQDLRNDYPDFAREANLTVLMGDEFDLDKVNFDLEKENSEYFNKYVDSIKNNMIVLKSDIGAKTAFDSKRAFVAIKNLDNNAKRYIAQMRYTMNGFYTFVMSHEGRGLTVTVNEEPHKNNGMTQKDIVEFIVLNQLDYFYDTLHGFGYKDSIKSYENNIYANYYFINGFTNFEETPKVIEMVNKLEESLMEFLKHNLKPEYKVPLFPMSSSWKQENVRRSFEVAVKKGVDKIYFNNGLETTLRYDGYSLKRYIESFSIIGGHIQQTNEGSRVYVNLKINKNLHEAQFYTEDNGEFVNNGDYSKLLENFKSTAWDYKNLNVVKNKIKEVFLPRLQEEMYNKAKTENVEIIINSETFETGFDFPYDNERYGGMNYHYDKITVSEATKIANKYNAKYGYEYVSNKSFNQLLTGVNAEFLNIINSVLTQSLATTLYKSLGIKTSLILREIYNFEDKSKLSDDFVKKLHNQIDLMVNEEKTKKLIDYEDINILKEGVTRIYTMLLETISFEDVYSPLFKNLKLLVDINKGKNNKAIAKITNFISYIKDQKVISYYTDSVEYNSKEKIKENISYNFFTTIMDWDWNNLDKDFSEKSREFISMIENIDSPSDMIGMAIDMQPLIINFNKYSNALDYYKSGNFDNSFEYIKSIAGLQYEIIMKAKENDKITTTINFILNKTTQLQLNNLIGENNSKKLLDDMLTDILNNEHTEVNEKLINKLLLEIFDTREMNILLNSFDPKSYDNNFNYYPIEYYLSSLNNVLKDFYKNLPILYGDSYFFGAKNELLSSYSNNDQISISEMIYKLSNSLSDFEKISNFIENTNSRIKLLGARDNIGFENIEYEVKLISEKIEDNTETASVNRLYEGFLDLDKLEYYKKIENHFSNQDYKDYIELKELFKNLDKTIFKFLFFAEEFHEFYSRRNINVDDFDAVMLNKFTETSIKTANINDYVEFLNKNDTAHNFLELKNDPYFKKLITRAFYVELNDDLIKDFKTDKKYPLYSALEYDETENISNRFVNTVKVFDLIDEIEQSTIDRKIKLNKNILINFFLNREKYKDAIEYLVYYENRFVLKEDILNYIEKYDDNKLRGNVSNLFLSPKIENGTISVEETIMLLKKDYQAKEEAKWSGALAYLNSLRSQNVKYIKAKDLKDVISGKEPIINSTTLSSKDRFGDVSRFYSYSSTSKLEEQNYLGNKLKLNENGEYREIVYTVDPKVMGSLKLLRDMHWNNKDNLFGHLRYTADVSYDTNKDKDQKIVVIEEVQSHPIQRATMFGVERINEMSFSNEAISEAQKQANLNAESYEKSLDLSRQAIVNRFGENVKVRIYESENYKTIYVDSIDHYINKYLNGSVTVSNKNIVREEDGKQYVKYELSNGNMVYATEYETHENAVDDFIINIFNPTFPADSVIDQNNIKDMGESLSTFNQEGVPNIRTTFTAMAENEYITENNINDVPYTENELVVYKIMLNDFIKKAVIDGADKILLSSGQQISDFYKHHAGTFGKEVVESKIQVIPYGDGYDAKIKVNSVVYSDGRFNNENLSIEVNIEDFVNKKYGTSNVNNVMDIWNLKEYVNKEEFNAIKQYLRLIKSNSESSQQMLKELGINNKLDLRVIRANINRQVFENDFNDNKINKIQKFVQSTNQELLRVLTKNELQSKQFTSEIDWEQLKNSKEFDSIYGEIISTRLDGFDNIYGKQLKGLLEFELTEYGSVPTYKWVGLDLENKFNSLILNIKGMIDLKQVDPLSKSLIEDLLEKITYGSETLLEDYFDFINKLLQVVKPNNALEMKLLEAKTFVKEITQFMDKEINENSYKTYTYDIVRGLNHGTMYIDLNINKELKDSIKKINETMYSAQDYDQEDYKNAPIYYTDKFKKFEQQIDPQVFVDTLYNESTRDSFLVRSKFYKYIDFKLTSIKEIDEKQLKEALTDIGHERYMRLSAVNKALPNSFVIDVDLDVFKINLGVEGSFEQQTRMFMIVGNYGEHIIFAPYKKVGNKNIIITAFYPTIETLRNYKLLENQLSNLNIKQIANNNYETYVLFTEQQYLLQQKIKNLEEQKKYGLSQVLRPKAISYTAINGMYGVREADLYSADEEERSFPETALQSGVIKGRPYGQIESDLQNGKFTYEIYSDKVSIQEAYSVIDRDGIDKAYQDFESAFSSNRRMTKKDIAIGEVLIYEMGKTTNKTKNKTRKVVKLISDLAILGTESGQVIQALSMLSKFTPQGRLMHMKRILDRIERQYINTKPFKFNIDPILFEELANARSMEEVQQIEEKIKKVSINQIPSTIMDKINTWRYLSMLGQPRTHLRNIIGNIIMTPLISTKNLVGYNLEKFIPVEKRTKSIFVGKQYRDYAIKDYQEIKEALSGGGKYDVKVGLEREKRIFKTKSLEWARKFNSNLLEMEDIFFSRMHYVNAMSSLLQARKIDLENITQKQLEEARKWSILEAQKAVFRDFNGLSNLLNYASKQNKLYYFAIQGIVPFTKTPFNIVKRGVEYSPLGLMNSITRGAYNHYKGKITTEEFIDSISSGMAGSIIMALGWLLASLGMLSMSGDDKPEKERYFDSMIGKQNFSLVFPHGTYTIDWAVPAVLPLFIGANLYNFLEKDQEGSIFNVVPQAFLDMFDPIFELTALSSLKSTLQSFQGSTIEVVSEAGTTIAQSYILQFFPTIFAQIARIIDPIRRSTYVSSESEMNPFVEKTVKKILNKIPFLSKLNEPLVDQFGKEMTNDDFNSLLGKVFAQMVSVGYYKTTDTTNEEQIIIDLFTKTLNQDVLPRVSPSYFTYEGSTYRLNPPQLTKFSKTLGSLSEKGIQELNSNSYYKSLTTDEKVNLIADMYEYAYGVAKEEALRSMGKKYEDKAYEKVKSSITNGVSASQYYIAKTIYGKIVADEVSKEKPFIDSLKNQGYSSSQIQYLLPVIGGYKLSQTDIEYILKGK